MAEFFSENQLPPFLNVNVHYPRPLPLALTSYWREQRERQQLVFYKQDFYIA